MEDAGARSQGSEMLGLAQWVLYKAILGTRVDQRCWGCTEGENLRQ